jgi:hypothetical protein
MHNDPTPELPALSAADRAALLALDEEAAERALEAEDPTAMALVTEYILAYSQKLGEELKAGRDYLPLLTPGEATAPLEAIAMMIVLDSAEAELEAEYSDDDA